jgi:isopenicillin N synthase-like dioxygenase
MLSVPTIDIRRFQNGSMSQAQFAALGAACEDHGFFLLSGHGQDALIAEVFAQSAGFFAQPRAAKLSVARNELNPLGYFDRELTKQKRDLKEVFDFKAGGYTSKDPARQTRWPDWDLKFREVLTEFFTVFTRLSEETMRMVFKSLGMPDAQAQQMLDDGFGLQHSSAARLNYYPANDPVPVAERDSVKALGDLALHHHTDPGAITLLLQDNHGGLQACSKTDGWIDVPPQPDTIVVNIGDVLQVWTNDRCTAGMHRVLPVQSPAGRYSTPFFYQPRYDAQIKPWVGDDGTAHYRTFSWREFIRGRVSDNFADYGAQDIQIDRYKLA